MVPIATNFFDPGQPGVLQHESTHHEIVVEEGRGIGSIDSDPAGQRSQMNDDLRPEVGIGALDAIRGAEVVIAAARHRDVPVAALRQLCHDVTAEEAAPARHHNARQRVQFCAHGATRVGCSLLYPRCSYL